MAQPEQGTSQLRAFRDITHEQPTRSLYIATRKGATHHIVASVARAYVCTYLPVNAATAPMHVKVYGNLTPAIV